MSPAPHRIHRPRGRWFGAALACLTLVLGLAVPVSAQAAPARQLPVTGPVLRAFDPPAQRWSAGHRGVDLAGTVGENVRAADAGQVSFVGTIAGVTSMSVRHGDGRRTTYQPLEPSVREGQFVGAGQVIGRLLPGHCDPACLHWGLIAADDYLDPLRWLGGAGQLGSVRLLPNGTQLRSRAADAGAASRGTADTVDTRPQVAGQTGSSTVASLPIAAPMTSGFGTRSNPVRGTSEVHDGIDFGAACGTPVRAAWSGVVSYAAPMSGFGNRVAVDHGTLDGQALSTSYNHLSDAGVGMVRVGDTVSAGQIIALVGTTGLSTGCHLHFSVYRQGSAVDPAPWLG